MIRLIPLIILFSLMCLAKIFRLGSFDHPGIESTFILGFIIISGYIIGEFLSRLKLPKITGYLITGIIFGPGLLGFVSHSVAKQLKLIDLIALSFISLSAGRELKLQMLKTRLRSILSITCSVIFLDFIVVTAFVFFLSSIFPFLRGVPPEIRLGVALLFGSLSLAKSPVTTIAVIEDTQSEGKYTETIMGIVVLKDVLLLIGFVIILSAAKLLLIPQESFSTSKIFLAKTAWKLLGSIFVGGLIGLIIDLYIQHIKIQLALFVPVVAFFITVVSQQLHLDPLLLSISAGFFIENFSPRGDEFLSAISNSRTLIYIVFFSINGATLDLGILKSVWFISVIILMVRLVSTWSGVYLGNRLSDNDPHMKRYGWMAFINQSGVTLALAIIIENTFPEFGAHIRAIAIAMIAVTDFIGPPLFKYSLIKSGEAKS